jgi:hypothetical protein
MIEWNEPYEDDAEPGADFIRTHWESDDGYYRVTCSQCTLGTGARVRPTKDSDGNVVGHTKPWHADQYYALTVHYGTDTRLIAVHGTLAQAQAACRRHDRTGARPGLRKKESRALARARAKDAALRPHRKKGR